MRFLYLNYAASPFPRHFGECFRISNKMRTFNGSLFFPRRISDVAEYDCKIEFFKSACFKLARYECLGEVSKNAGDLKFFWRFLCVAFVRFFR